MKFLNLKVATHIFIISYPLQRTGPFASFCKRWIPRRPLNPSSARYISHAPGRPCSSSSTAPLRTLSSAVRLRTRRPLLLHQRTSTLDRRCSAARAMARSAAASCTFMPGRRECVSAPRLPTHATDGPPHLPRDARGALSAINPSPIGAPTTPISFPVNHVPVFITNGKKSHHFRHRPHLKVRDPHKSPPFRRRPHLKVFFPGLVVLQETSECSSRFCFLFHLHLVSTVVT